MLKIGDYIVYKKDVCQVKEIKEKGFNNVDYYVLVPLLDDSLKIDVPIEDRSNNLRHLITKDSIDEIIKNIPSIEIIETNEKMIENEYKNLLKTDNHENLIKIIKTTYTRNKERLDNKRKIGDKDEKYFKLAEKYLYTEFSVVLGLSYDDTKKYIIEEVTKLVGK